MLSNTVRHHMESRHRITDCYPSRTASNVSNTSSYTSNHINSISSSADSKARPGHSWLHTYSSHNASPTN